MLALLLSCSLLFAAGAGAVKGIEEFTADDPWDVRADQVCLKAGGEYLNADGRAVDLLRDRLEVTEQALTDLREIGNSVPLDSTLEYQTMLSYKEETLSLLRRKLKLRREGRSTGAVDNSLDSVFLYIYGPYAEELGLSVCGQGSGNQ